ncbi:MAG: cell division protein FtsQ/DivIB [Streptosporangiaceae bacterium]
MIRGRVAAARAGAVTGQAAPRPAAPGQLSAPGQPGASQPGAGPRWGRDPWKAAFFLVMALAIAAAAIWALLGSSLVVVRSVTVTGTRLVSPAEVRRAAGVRYGTPLIRIDTQRVAQQVERLAQVQSAQVSRDWPSTLHISVLERTPALAVELTGRYELVDEYGVVVRSAVTRPHGLPLLKSRPAELRGSPQVRAAALVLRELPAGLRRRVTAVSAPGADQVMLDLRGRITVEWGGPARAAAKKAELRILMRTHAAYYDVSGSGAAVTGG